VAKAAPDGYTLLVGSVSNMVLNSGLYPSLPYDPQRDFEPIGVAVGYSYTLMSRKDLGIETLAEVLKQAKAKPRALSYASAGNGSGQHVLAAATWHSAGVELLHVPYRGAQAAYQDLLGGRVDLFFDLSSTARAQIDGTDILLAREGEPFVERRRDFVGDQGNRQIRAAHGLSDVETVKRDSTFIHAINQVVLTRSGLPVLVQNGWGYGDSALDRAEMGGIEPSVFTQTGYAGTSPGGEG